MSPYRPSAVLPMEGLVRRTAVLSLLLLVVVCLGDVAVARADAPPASVDLSGSSWEFKADPLDVGRYSGWQVDPGEDGWSPKDVPSVFDPVPVPSEFGGTVGWYRLRFTAPAAVPGFAWGVSFQQVRRVSQVWLNGRPLGHNDNPYIPFMLPALGLKPGETNTLTVRVDNRKQGQVREGWWNWGGITRPVSLVPLGAVQLKDIGLLPRLHCVGGGCQARVLLDTVVRNRTAGPLNPIVTVSLTAPDGTQSRRAVHAGVIPARASRHLQAWIPVAGSPQLWSPEAPNLYDAVVSADVSGKTVQVGQMRIGLRSVRVKQGLLYLNGRALQLRGASIQEDLPDHGPALTDADIDQIVGDLKELGANVTRAHYLLNEKLLDKLDEAGIMVWSQAANYHSDRQLTTPAGRKEALDMVRGTVLAARNHPSVFTNSVANELSAVPDKVPGTRAFLRRAAALTRRLNPYLPVSLDLLSYPGFPRQKTYDYFDLLGINNYFGWYKGKAAHYVGDFHTLRPYLKAMRIKYPRQAMMMTEFGAEATFHGPPTEKQTYEFQSRYLARTLRVVKSFPWLAGAIYWTAREFAVKPDWDGGANIPPSQRTPMHRKGLISYDGTPKPAANVAHAIFTSTPPFAPPSVVAQARRETLYALKRARAAHR